MSQHQEYMYEDQIRKMMSEIESLKSELEKTKEKLNQSNYFPNGWKQPTFMNIDDEYKSLSFEFFVNGDDMLSFHFDQDEGAMTILTLTRDQKTVMGIGALKFLQEILTKDANKRKTSQ